MMYLQADISEGESIWTGPVCCVESMAEAEAMTMAEIVADWEMSLTVPEFTTPEAWEASGAWHQLLDAVDQASFLNLDPFRALVELDLVDVTEVGTDAIVAAINNRQPLRLALAI